MTLHEKKVDKLFRNVIKADTLEECDRDEEVNLGGGLELLGQIFSNFKHSHYYTRHCISLLFKKVS